MSPFLLLVLAYALGATPTSYWVGKGVYGVDLRERGSGNLGATNTFRVLGLKAAAPVMVVDVLKGWLPVWLFPRLDAAPWEWALLYGAAAILGHVFSAWVRFRGGKGVATSGGVFLALAPLAVLVAFSVWLLTVLAVRIVSLGSILAALSAPLAVALLPPVGTVVPTEGRGGLLAFTVALAAFVVWAHRGNIRRLLRGEEPVFGRGRGPGAGRPPEAAMSEPRGTGEEGP